MLYLTCTTITSGDLAHDGVSRAKDWVSVDCGTNTFHGHKLYKLYKRDSEASHNGFLKSVSLFPFTVSCRIDFAKVDLEIWQNHLSFHFLSRSGLRHSLQWLLGSYCEHPLWCNVTRGQFHKERSYD